MPDSSAGGAGRIVGHVFVVTYGRSGSTLLQAILNDIDGYCIRGENQNALQHLAQAWITLTDSDEIAKRRRLGADAAAPGIPGFGTPEDPWFGAESIRPDALAARLGAAFVDTVLCPPPGTRVTGFKEIRYSARPGFLPRQLGFMRRAFPGARFVFNTRDPEAVARSGWWADLDPARVMAELSAADRAFAAYVERHPDHAMLVHYDTYRDTPEALRGLFAFLEEPFDRDRVAAVMARPLAHLKSP